MTGSATTDDGEASRSQVMPGLPFPTWAAPAIRSLYDYWLSLHPASGLPGRQHFDPVDIPTLLPNLWMVDVLAGRFRFRLIGTAIVAYTGRDSTGQWLDEVQPGHWAREAAAAIEVVARSARPLWRESAALANPEKTWITAERLYLPLAADGANPDIIIAMTIYRTGRASTSHHNAGKA